MRSSQLSMETYLGRFENALFLLENDADYLPNRTDIQKSSLAQFSIELKESNSRVRLLETALQDFRTHRNSMAFKRIATNPENTVEAIIMNVLNYIGAENGKENSVYKAIKGFNSKMNPKTKTVRSNGTKGNSRSEKTFTALSGYLAQVIHLISNTPNLIYNPSNQSIKLDKLISLQQEIHNLNLSIAGAERNLKDARILRQKLFNGEHGAKQKAVAIKLYLASYSGGKQNPKYIQFVNAFK